MIHKRIVHASLASVLLLCGTAPVFAQGFLDRMKEDAERRAENKAVRDAENPQAAQKADAPRRHLLLHRRRLHPLLRSPRPHSRGAGHAGTGAVRNHKERLPKSCTENGQDFTFFQS